MKPFGKKHFLHNILHSKVSVIVIIVFAIYLSISVFERFSVERDMAERRFVSEKELAELRARKEILEKKVKSLEEENGIESEIRRNFDVVKEGEQVVIIIDDEDVTEEISEKKEDMVTKQPEEHPWFFWIQ